MTAGPGSTEARAMICERSNVLELYSRMSADGVDDSEMDGRAGRSPEGSIDCHDILETALSFGSRYGDFFIRLTGRPVPWLLYGPDSNADFDRKVRRRIDSAISIAKKDLKAMGLSPGDDDYDRFLAFGLYCYAFLQEKEDLSFVMRDDPPRALPYIMPVKAMGLLGLAAHMTRAGGLGLGREPFDAEVEATALEALRLRAGLCTERSYILYAIFDRAGLDAGFSFMTYQGVMSAWMRSFGTDKRPPVDVESYYTGHIVPRITAGGRSVYFEPNAFAFNVDYGSEASAMSLREVYQCYLSNLLFYIYNKGDFAAADRMVTGGLTLSDGRFAQNLLYRMAVNRWNIRDSLVVYGGGIISAGAAAIETLSHLVEKHPGLDIARDKLCNIMVELGQLDEAAECVAGLPDDSPFKQKLLIVLAAAREDWTAQISHLEAALEAGVSRAMVLPALAFCAEKTGDSKRALELYKEASRLVPMNSAYRAKIYELSVQAGDHAGASSQLSAMLLDSPHDGQMMLSSAKLFASLSRKEEAEQRFVRYAVLTVLSDSAGLRGYEELARAADELGLWEAADTAVRPLIDESNFYLMASLINLNALARRGDAAEEAKAALSSLARRLQYLSGKSMVHLKAPVLTADAAGKEETAFVPLTQRPQHLSQKFVVPPEIYWHMAEAVELTGSWRELHALCLGVAMNSPFDVFAMHASWKAGDRRLMEEDIARFNESIALFAEAEPGSRNIGNLSAICKAVETLPPALLKEGLHGADLGRPFALLGETLEHVGSERLALLSYLKAERMGHRSEKVSRAIERLEKLLEETTT